jgi:hypothetical protein
MALALQLSLSCCAVKTIIDDAVKLVKLPLVATCMASILAVWFLQLTKFWQLSLDSCMFHSNLLSALIFISSKCKLQHSEDVVTLIVCVKR